MLHYFEEKDGSLLFRENGESVMVTPWGANSFRVRAAFLAAEYDCIEGRRGRGMLQGLVFSRPVNGVIQKALEKGLILINAGANVIRFVPPLIITREHVDEMAEILKSCLDEME